MMAEQKDIFDIMLDERELRRTGLDLIPTYDNGFVTIKEKTFVDNFEQQIQTGVQELFNRFKLNEQTKEDIAKGGEVLEGVGKGLFAGAITNPLALIVNEDSKFMQDARQAVEFNPDFDIANMGYEASKFFGAFLGLGKLMGIGKAAIQFNKLGAVGKEAVRGLGSVFAGYEGSDENLVDAFMSMGANPEEYPILRRLMTDPDDSDLEGRLKNVLADLPIEAIAPSIILTTKIFKKYRKAKKDNAPNFQATEKEFEDALNDLKKQSNELLDQYSDNVVELKGEKKNNSIQKVEKPRDESSGHAADRVPAQFGPPAHNMNMTLDEEFTPEGYSTFSANVGNNYENLRTFLTGRRGSQESRDESNFLNILQKIKGNPNAEITMYRASPTNDLRPGDLITSSKAEAQFYVDESKITRDDIRKAEKKRRLETDKPINLQEEKNIQTMDRIIDIFPEPITTPSKIHTYKLKAKDVRWDGNNGLLRWGYFPEAKIKNLEGNDG